MPDKYRLKNERDKTMFIFEKNGKVYGHIIKDKTTKAPAKFVFETPRYNSVEELKVYYPEMQEYDV